MVIKETRRPWIKNNNHRPNKELWYQSKEWKSTKASFKQSVPIIKLPSINGRHYENRYCVFCWEKGVINSEKIEIDHIIAVKDGGHKTDHKNLRSLCHAHHNGKTHNERKVRK